MRRLLPVLLLIVALTSTAPIPMPMPVSARGFPALPALNLRLADLPAGTKLAVEVSGPPARLEAPAIGLDRRLLVGMVAADARVFTLRASSPAVLLAVIGRYSSAAVAHATLQAARSHMGTTVPLALGSVGDERSGGHGVSRTLSPQPFGAGTFRRGAYLAYMVLVNPPKAFPFTRLASLARLVDARIQHTH
jgi:hypothetical protein